MLILCTKLFMDSYELPRRRGPKPLAEVVVHSSEAVMTGGGVAGVQPAEGPAPPPAAEAAAPGGCGLRPPTLATRLSSRSKGLENPGRMLSGACGSSPSLRPVVKRPSNFDERWPTIQAIQPTSVRRHRRALQDGYRPRTVNPYPLDYGLRILARQRRTTRRSVSPTRQSQTAGLDSPTGSLPGRHPPTRVPPVARPARPVGGLSPLLQEQTGPGRRVGAPSPNGPWARGRHCERPGPGTRGRREPAGRSRPCSHQAEDLAGRLVARF
jgi:hypothetical protein